MVKNLNESGITKKNIRTRVFTDLDCGKIENKKKKIIIGQKILLK